MSGALTVDRDQLLSTLLAADPQPGDLVYVARRGDTYTWHCTGGGELPAQPEPADAWIYYSWQRPLGDSDAARAMVEDLLAEMESMTGCGNDRCRWPLDQPYPLGH